MDESKGDPEGSAPMPRRRRPSWLTGRVAVLLVVLIAIGSVAAWRIVDRLDRPAAGDRHDVTYAAADSCGYFDIEVDGLLLRGMIDPRDPLVPAGNGTLVLRRVWDLDGDGGGLGASGVLTMEDGSEHTVEGGTEGKVFFNAACPIRSD